MTLALLILACAGPKSSFAELEDLGVLGLSPDGSMYLCGDAQNADASRWLVESEADRWESADGLWLLTLSGERFTLEDPGEQSWEGELRTVEEGGVYSATPDGCRSGAVMADGALYGTWCDGQGGFEQVEPVEPVTEAPEVLLVHLRTNTGKIFTMDRLP